MSCGTLRADRLPHGLNCHKNARMIFKYYSLPNASLRFRGQQPIISAHNAQRHSARPVSRVRKRGWGSQKCSAATAFEDAELSELDDSLGDAEAELEAQFVEETRSQGGGSLARGLLADPGIEGNPLNLLKVSEAYWTVCFFIEGPCSVPRNAVPSGHAVDHVSLTLSLSYSIC